MNNPAEAILIVAAGIAVVMVVLWPKYGILHRLQRTRLNTRRVVIEDALKHLYDCEYKKLVCTRLSVAGALSISGDDATKLLARLEMLGLLSSQGEGFVLTGEGRAYALRIIRVHRLWERYLADETGMEETQWHDEAEVQEHRISSAEAEALAEQMGNPHLDPHGDPIPTAAGELPVRRGQPLTKLEPGKVGQIVHLEDEPAIVYAQLVAQGLYPGLFVRMMEVSQEKIRFEANGTENVLAPIVAANVTIVSLPTDVPPEGPHETLGSLDVGEMGVVVGISRACRGQQRRRLMDLGVVPGTMITAEMRSASGDPTAYMIRGATIALRSKQANMIHIRRENGSL